MPCFINKMETHIMDRRQLMVKRIMVNLKPVRQDGQNGQNGQNGPIGQDGLNGLVGQDGHISNMGTPGGTKK